MRYFQIALSAMVIVFVGVSVAGAQDPAGAPASPDSRLFFGATARSLPAGEGYFSVRALSLPTFQIGVTDRFSIGAGMPVIAPGKVLFLSPKYEVYRGSSTSVAAGMVHVAVFGAGGINVAYGVATTSGAAGSVTAGVGVATASFGGERGHVLVGMIGGQRRVSERVEFVTENYIFLAGAAVVSGGVRISRGRFSTDLGLMMPVIAQGFVGPAPIINVAWKF